MAGDVVDQAGKNFGGALAAGSEGSAAHFLSLALSPIGLEAIAFIVIVAFYMARS